MTWEDDNAATQTTYSATLTTNSTAPGTSITVTTSTTNTIEAGDMIVFDSVTMPTSSGLSAALFEDKICQVISVPSNTTFTITSPTAETGGGGSDLTSGSAATLKPYVRVGPSEQSYGYGFGIGNYGGTISGSVSTTINGALNADTAGTGGVGTSVTLTSTTGFTAPAGTAAVGTVPTAELITYTGVAGADLTTITRGALGTATPGSSNGQAHSSLDPAQDATNWAGWGEAVEASSVTLEPGLWSLSNWGPTLVATIANGKTYTWDSTIADNFGTRASRNTTDYITKITGDEGNPTASRMSLISPTTRHLIHLGTETTIGTASTQDDMFIRFSNQEQINTYAPSADNSAGTYRLQDGSKIMGAITGRDAI